MLLSVSLSSFFVFRSVCGAGLPQMTVCLCYRKSIKSFSCATTETAFQSQSKGLKEQYMLKNIEN